MRRKFHARCGAGEKSEVVTPEIYLSLFGKIPEFPQKISTCRKYNISTTIVLQSIAQIKMLYKDDYETIIGNCDTAICLGTNEQTTADYFSKKLGKATITSRGKSTQVGKAGGSMSFNQTGRELMTPDEIMTIPFDECIVMMNHISPFYDKKYPLEKHPQFDYTGDKSSDNFYYLENDDKFLCTDNTEACNADAVDQQFRNNNNEEDDKYNPVSLQELIEDVLGNNPDEDNYFLIRDVDENVKQSLFNIERERFLNNIAECIQNGYKTPYYNGEDIEPSIIQPLAARAMRQFDKKIEDVVVVYNSIQSGNHNFCIGAKSEDSNSLKVMKKTHLTAVKANENNVFTIYNVKDYCSHEKLSTVINGLEKGEEVVIDTGEDGDKEFSM